ncbi:hypothetical protein BCV72DRAFT_219933 [Rhizopus microsporus var. microsporus]|uniref:Uncharacterized protein n=2 Tax=Rhizopus microsporus TaxID=58291 RepID=A0A2G4SU46_RHIZD|nr:uncharacterized protein RHIMIDRAFT_284517 [Rhizopus microsporus ATCC 52813]ORE11397.1 hypothetical protein BCV72DRAFT_219933 [Rhizopus microsporus var. microsporus]PHZ12281.1 hypothetical protein RHIMIDRAFT_284517 [Rhizopus microsporus ATCC 52813]
MRGKRKSIDTSEAQLLKKTRINDLRKDYKFLAWVDSSFQKQPPDLDYFSFAEHFDSTEDATNANYMDLLLTLQSKQSNKVTNVAHSAETTFATRRFHSTEFGKKYHEY